MSEYDEICKIIDEVNLICENYGIDLKIEKPTLKDSMIETITDVMMQILKINVSFLEKNIKKNSVSI